MTAFDPAEAEKAYAEMQLAELVCIAYLDDGYLPEARSIATRELDRRGVPPDRAALIEQTRRELEERKQAAAREPEAIYERSERFKNWIAIFTGLAALWVMSFVAPLIY